MRAGNAVVPDHVPIDLVETWDFIADPGFLDDPHATVLAAPRKRAFWTTANRGHWVLTDADDVRTALQTPATFSSISVNIPGAAHNRKLIPVELDPPDHGRHRALLSPFFTPHAAARLELHLRTYTDELIDSFVDDGRCELIAQFASQLPAKLFLGLFDLPIEDANLIVRWIEGLASRVPGLHPFDASKQLDSYLYAAIDERLASPGDDLISQLSVCEIDGEAINRSDLFDFVYLLLIAGLDTTTAVMAFGWRHLASNPAERRRIALDPTTAAAAAEEILYWFPLPNLARTVAHDVDFAGVSMRAGDRVLLPVTLMHRSGDDAIDLDLDGANRRNYAFGAGPHRCLGSHLARREIAIALELWHARIPDYELDDTSPARGHGGPIMGLDRVGLQWSTK